MSNDPKPPTDPAPTWDELLRDRDLERLNEIPRSRLADDLTSQGLIRWVCVVNDGSPCQPMAGHSDCGPRVAASPATGERETGR